MRYLMMLCLLLLCFKGIGQLQKRISGKILSAETKKPVEGATIHFVKSNSSVLSDKNGMFEIEVRPGKIINITHAEFETYSFQPDTVKGTFVEIYLEPEKKTLSPVIVNTGYKEIDPGKATGSYITINSDLINRSTAPDLLSRLQDVTPSLYFDDRRNTIAPLQIRGLSSLGYSSTMPLIILNNFPYEGDINSINPGDIESVSILRDAAAYAIWGARAGNGVIVITTKQGSYNKKLLVSFSSNLRITPKPDLSKSNNLSSPDYIYVEKFLFENGFYDDLFYPGNYQPVSPVIQILDSVKNGLLSSGEANQRINILSTQDTRKDITRYILRQKAEQQYTLSITGGSSRSSQYASIGYYKEISNLIANKNYRVTATLSNTYKPNAKLHINTDIILAQQQIQNNNSLNIQDMLIPGTANYLYPYARLANDHGDPLTVDAYFRGSYTDTAGSGKLLDWKYKPLEDINHIKNTSTTRGINASIGFTYQFIPSLNVQFKYQYQNDKFENSDLRNSNSFEARNYVNLFSQIENGEVKYIVPRGGILDSRFATSEANNIRTQINFDKKINSSGRLSISAGGETRTLTVKNSSNRVYGFNDNLSVSLVDYANPYPTFNDVYGDMYIPTATGFSSTTDNFVSAFALADYNYRSIFSLSGSFRYDASNLFGVDANRKGVPLWSAGGALSVSSLKGYDFKWLPYLRLRLTYGYGGNVSHSVSALTTLSFGSASDQRITNLPYAYINTFPNPQLHWEKVATTNLGLDFGTGNNKIRGSLEFYKKKSFGVLFPKDMDPTLGTITLTSNSADLTSLGFDLSLKTTNLYRTYFEWESEFNLSNVKTKISKILYSNINTIGFVNDGLNLMPIEGFEPFQIVSYRWAGLDNSGNPQGMLNGEPGIQYDSLLKTPLEQQVNNGSAIPHFFGNLRNDFRVYKFNFSFNINFKFGYYFRKPSLDYYDLYFRGKGVGEFEKRWQKSGDETTTNVPSMVYPYDSKRNKFYKYAEVNALPGDYIKLRDLRFAYLPFNSSKTVLRSFQLYAMISNLNFSIWKANKEGFDPELPFGNIDKPVYSIGIKTNL